MSQSFSSEEALRSALAVLQRDGPSGEAFALLAPIAPEDPRFGAAQHLRALCALKQDDAARAKDLMLDAWRRGERNASLLRNLSRAAAAANLPDDALAAILEMLKGVDPKQLQPVLTQALEVLGFFNKELPPTKEKVFRQLLLPLLGAVLARRDMDNAMAIEGVLFEHYVKAVETEAHFAACMAAIEPLLTEAGRYWRAALPPLPQPSLTPPYRIGFFIHSASTLAHIEVLLNTFKGYRMLDEQPFEPIVYCFGGKSPAMERALAALGVRLVMLNERYPETAQSPWARLLKLRELLAEDGVQQLVWTSMVAILPLAFGMRIAPVQTWFAMKYRNFSQPDIDGYVTGSALTRFGAFAGRRWRTAMLGVDDWYAPALEPQAAALRSTIDAPVVAMTLARTEKMQDPAYLQAMVALLQANAQAVFLWAGRAEDPTVVEAFRAGGVLERTRFIGWVNTRLYAQVADVFLDTFPFPCGFTLFQAMAAGKPVLIYDSPEAAQTGLWNFIKPLVEGDDGTPEERAELQAIIGDPAQPLIPVARTPEDYVAHASRLLRDPAVRGGAGSAAKRFIDRYFSDPKLMGGSLAAHFIELVEEKARLVPSRGAFADPAEEAS